ncbi:MAG TPA: response regulator [Candidatus Acidoferrales bacterium]|nr:response regulator [Candidatus Acidoferrales bacterium]
MTTLEGKKILVADDDASILRIVQMVLSRHGMTVVTAEDGEEALQKAVLEKPDAMLLDIHMPKMDGLELLSKLKATEATAHIPVGFLTAEKELESFKQAQELGVLLYIIKPFKPERLVSNVGILLAYQPPPEVP